MLTGLKLALEAAGPRCILFVFTDAEAEDYDLLSQILTIIMQKQCQVCKYSVSSDAFVLLLVLGQLCYEW